MAVKGKGIAYAATDEGASTSGKRKVPSAAATSTRAAEKRAKKKKVSEVLRFLDAEAVVADPSDSEDDASADDDSFIDDLGDFMEDVEPMGKGDKGSGKGSFVPLVPKEEELSGDELEEFVRRRYGPGSKHVVYDNAAKEYDDMMLSVHSASDPNVYRVKCMTGRERQIAFCLIQKFIDLQMLNTKLQIASVFALDHAKGYVYIEADKECDVLEACKGFTTIYSKRITCVPKNEVPRLLSTRNQPSEVTEGMWVRVKQGKYKGDLAQVVAVDVTKKQATIKLIPRIDLQAIAKKFGGGISLKQSAVPEPRLISSRELEEFRSHIQMRRDRQTGEFFEIFDGLMLKDGYLYKRVSFSSLSSWGVQPSRNELLKFEDSKKVAYEDGGSTSGDNKDAFPFEASNSNLRPKEGSGFQLHDLVLYGRKNFGIIIGMEKDCIQDKEGIVRHMYRGVLFIYDANHEESGGFFCAKSDLCESTVCQKDNNNSGCDSAFPGFQDSEPPVPQTPRRQFQPREGRNNFDSVFSIGQTLRIRVGPLKGYLCRVIRLYRSEVTVKLDSLAKVISVKCEHLTDASMKSSENETRDDLGAGLADDFGIPGSFSKDGLFDDGNGASADKNSWDIGVPSTANDTWNSTSSGISGWDNKKPSVPGDEAGCSNKDGWENAGASTGNQNSSWDNSTSWNKPSVSEWDKPADKTGADNVVGDGWASKLEIDKKADTSNDAVGKSDSWGKPSTNVDNWSKVADQGANGGWDNPVDCKNTSGAVGGEQASSWDQPKLVNQDQENSWNKGKSVVVDEDGPWGKASSSKNKEGIADKTEDPWSKPVGGISGGSTGNHADGWGQSKTGGSGSSQNEQWGTSNTGEGAGSGWNKSAQSGDIKSGGWNGSDPSSNRQGSDWNTGGGSNKDQDKSWGTPKASGGDWGSSEWKKGSVENTDTGGNKDEGANWNRTGGFDGGRASGRGRGRGGDGRGNRDWTNGDRPFRSGDGQGRGFGRGRGRGPPDWNKDQDNSQSGSGWGNQQSGGWDSSKSFGGKQSSGWGAAAQDTGDRDGSGWAKPGMAGNNETVGSKDSWKSSSGGLSSGWNVGTAGNEPSASGSKWDTPKPQNDKQSTWNTGGVNSNTPKAFSTDQSSEWNKSSAGNKTDQKESGGSNWDSSKPSNNRQPSSWDDDAEKNQSSSKVSSSGWAKGTTEDESGKGDSKPEEKWGASKPPAGNQSSDWASKETSGWSAPKACGGDQASGWNQGSSSGKDSSREADAWNAPKASGNQSSAWNQSSGVGGADHQEAGGSASPWEKAAPSSGSQPSGWKNDAGNGWNKPRDSTSSWNSSATGKDNGGNWNQGRSSDGDQSHGWNRGNFGNDSGGRGRGRSFGDRSSGWNRGGDGDNDGGGRGRGRGRSSGGDWSSGWNQGNNDEGDKSSGWNGGSFEDGSGGRGRGGRGRGGRSFGGGRSSNWNGGNDDDGGSGGNGDSGDHSGFGGGWGGGSSGDQSQKTGGNKGSASGWNTGAGSNQEAGGWNQNKGSDKAAGSGWNTSKDGGWNKGSAVVNEEGGGWNQNKISDKASGSGWGVSKGEDSQAKGQSGGWNAGASASEGGGGWNQNKGSDKASGSGWGSKDASTKEGGSDGGRKASGWGQDSEPSGAEGSGSGGKSGGWDSAGGGKSKGGW
ncbi:hypothetical protein QJS04_geneDACA013068 [Acorus gramineus]|uniref:KOW domain-containing protein n=1 Tax=Acorus gramineus TaxID=55184 RepID=A0AAV9B2U7_ACOGR|nr:hypothetical protein QJS04_geneDACA013068 [Acorus gramineus]